MLRDLREAGVEIVTIGQYLRPSREQLPVARFYTPEEFAALKREGCAWAFGTSSPARWCAAPTMPTSKANH